MQLQKTKRQDDHIYSEDYYAVLGLKADANRKEIKKAFGHLANRFHPDKQSGDNEKFLLIMEAYMILINPEKRKHYDDHGRWDKDEKQQAENDIRAFVDKVITGEHDLSHIDLITLIKKAIDSNLNALKGEEKSKSARLDRLKNNKNRSSNELILSVFRSRIGVLEREIESINTNIRITNISMILLSKCHYSFDIKEAGEWKSIPTTFTWSI